MLLRQYNTCYFCESNALHWDIPNGIFMFSSEEFQEFIHCETWLLDYCPQNTSSQFSVVGNRNLLSRSVYECNVASSLVVKIVTYLGDPYMTNFPDNTGSLGIQYYFGSNIFRNGLFMFLKRTYIRFYGFFGIFQGFFPGFPLCYASRKSRHISNNVSILSFLEDNSVSHWGTKLNSCIRFFPVDFLSGCDL